MRYFLCSFLTYFSVAFVAQGAPFSETVQELTLEPLAEASQSEGLEKKSQNEYLQHEANTPEYDLYEQGRHYLTQQRIDLAQKIFKEIVETYGETPEAILAGFWLGEFMLIARNYSGATIAFGQAYGELKKRQKQKDFSQDQFHGEQDRFPEILAKLAFSLKMIKKRGDACITLRQIKRDYKVRPKTLDWYTEQLSKELKCR